MTVNTYKFKNAGLKKFQIKSAQLRMMKGEVFYCGDLKMFYLEGSEPFRVTHKYKEKKIDAGSPINEFYNELENWEVQVGWIDCMPVLCWPGEIMNEAPLLICERDGTELVDSTGKNHMPGLRPVTLDEIKRYIF